VVNSSAGQSRGSGNPFADLVGMALTAAVAKASPNYMPLARQANDGVIHTLPPGPLNNEYGKDAVPAK